MRRSHVLILVALSALPLGGRALAQLPTITSYSANGCTYTVGLSRTPCSIGPGTKLAVRGKNFGNAGGIVNTCDCPEVIVPLGNWTDTKIVGYVYSVYPNPTPGSAGIQVENTGGGRSAAVPYAPLAAHISRITVGSCTYIAGISKHQCVITPGTQFTLYGSYFGAGANSGPQVTMCDCPNPTIESWNPGWIIHPKPTGNVITATAIDAICGNSIVVYAEDFNVLPSNPIPYTTCQ